MATGRLLRLSAGRRTTGRLRKARIAEHAVVVLDPPLGRQPVVVESHRIEDLVAPHPPVAGHGVGVGVGEDVPDVQLPRHRGRRGVDGEDAPTAGPSGRRRRSPPRSHRADHLASRPSRDGRSGTTGGPGRSSGWRGRRRRRLRSSRLVHGRVTVPECCASTTQPRAPSSRSSSANPATSRCTSAGPPSTTSPTSATAASPWPSTSCAGTSSSPVSRSATSPTSPTSTTRSSPGPTRRAGRLTDVAREFEAAWWAAIDGLGVKRPTVSPRATEYVDHMVALVADLVGRGTAYETSDGVYLSVDRGRRLRPAGPPEPRFAAVRGPGGAGRGEALAPRLRPLEEGQARASRPGPRPGARAGRDGTPSAWSCRSISWATASTSTAAASTSPSPITRTSGPRPWPRAGPSPATGPTTGTSSPAGEKMSKSLGNFTSLADLLERTDGRAYRLLLLRSHYRSQVEVTPDTVADAEEALVGLDALVRRFDLERRSPSAATATEALALGADADAAAPPSWPPWTTTSAPRRRWPGSSNWPAGPTWPPTRGDAGRGPPAGPDRGRPLRRPRALPPRAARPSTRPPGQGGRSATRPGPAGTWPGPTPSAGRARGRGLGRWRTDRRAAELHR